MLLFCGLLTLAVSVLVHPFTVLLLIRELHTQRDLTVRDQNLTPDLKYLSLYSSAGSCFTATALRSVCLQYPTIWYIIIAVA